MGYKILGYAVWHGSKWYVKRRYGAGGGGRRAAVLGVAGLTVAALAVVGARRRSV